MIYAFPLVARIGKIRDVARKLVATKSERHAESYRRQVTDALTASLSSKRVPDEAHASELTSFWRAVELEAARIVHGTRARR